jgi:hypothetical protein
MIETIIPKEVIDLIEQLKVKISEAADISEKLKAIGWDLGI